MKADTLTKLPVVTLVDDGMRLNVIVASAGAACRSAAIGSAMSLANSFLIMETRTGS